MSYNFEDVSSILKTNGITGNSKWIVMLKHNLHDLSRLCPSAGQFQECGEDNEVSRQAAQHGVAEKYRGAGFHGPMIRPGKGECDTEQQRNRGT